MFARNGIGVITIDTNIRCPIDDTLTTSHDSKMPAAQERVSLNPESFRDSMSLSAAD